MTTPNSEVPLSSVRDYWNRRPCNIRHSPLTQGSKAYFNQVEARKYLVEPHIPKLADFSRWKGKKVLEIGCGIGTDTINFARAGAMVTAVDLSSQSLAIAAQRAEVFGLADRVKFFEANAEELDRYVPISQYDLVYSFGVIHHTPHPDRVIVQLKQYMGRGSQLRLMVYNRWSWKAIGLVLRAGGNFRNIDEIVRINSEAQEGCPVTYTYTKDSIKDLLLGFGVDSISVEHIFPYQIGPYKRYEYRMVPWFGILPKPLFHWLEHKLGWHLCVVAHL